MSRSSSISSMNGDKQDYKNLTDTLPCIPFLKPLYFEVPQQDAKHEFVGREWMFREMSDHLQSSQGVVISGAPGAGKTSAVLQLVQNSCFFQDGKIQSESNNDLTSLSSKVIGYHFCQAENSATCSVANWIHNLAAQLSQVPSLNAYRDFLSSHKDMRNILSLVNCVSDPSRAFSMGILQPLDKLRKMGKISSNECFLLIDALCEDELHRPDNGDTITMFVKKHLDSFPDWLKIICTVRTEKKEIASNLPFKQISLDQVAPDDKVSQDISRYIKLRMENSQHMKKNIAKNLKTQIEENLEVELEKHLGRLSQGCFLYVKMTMDLIERGHLVIKSSSFSVLPVSLSEVFLLEFNLKFSSNQAFKKAANILSICLASLQPLNLPQIYQIIGSQYATSSSLSWNEFLSDFKVLAETLIVRHDDSIMFFHPAFREWLIKRNNCNSSKFLCDPRKGHEALAHNISRMESKVHSEKTLELCHHILKGHLFRNNQVKTPSRDLQSFFVALCSEDVSSALSFYRNVYNPNVNISRLLLLAGASPNARTCFLDEAPLICLYANQGNTEMVSLLLQFGAQVDATNSLGKTALGFSAAGGQIECVRRLVESSASLTVVDSSGICPLVLSAKNGHLNIVEHLVSSDWGLPAEDNLSLKDMAQQATVAAAYAGHATIIDFLLDMSEVDINNADTLMMETPLTAAASAGNQDCCQALLARVANINTTNPRGETPLYTASKAGHWAVCEMLLKQEASVKDHDCLGRTPLIAAAKEGHLGIVELLVDNGSELEELDKDKLTALMWACAEGRLTTARYLVGKGAAIHTTDKHGRTALDLAAYKGDTEIIQLLLDHGAMMEHVDLNGMRPLDRAISCNKVEAVKCFLRKGAKLGPSTWAMADAKPAIMLTLLNKLLEDGNTLFKKGRIEEASQRYLYATNRVPNINQASFHHSFEQLSIHLMLNQARCKRKMNKNQEAIMLATEVLITHPSSYQALYARARAHHAAGNIEEAHKDLVDAVKSAPEHQELQKMLVKVKHERRSVTKNLSVGIMTSNHEELGDGTSI